jgi:hypothetical protein
MNFVIRIVGILGVKKQHIGDTFVCALYVVLPVSSFLF